MDPRELEEYTKRTPEDPINNVVMALVYEFFDDYHKALKIWQSLKGKTAGNLTEGCERTVSILKKKKDIALIKEYGKWVLEENPQIGLSLFTTDAKTGELPVDMNPDEVIDYLKGIDNEHYPYLEAYYEYLISNNNAPDSYYTQLATLYVDKIFKMQPRNFATPSKCCQYFKALL